MEQERVDNSPESRTADDYWLDLARDLVSLGDMPHDAPDYVMSYRLYALAVCAAVEQDIQAGVQGNHAMLLNRRFHEGMERAQAQIGESATGVHRFMAQDLTARQWDNIIGHEIGANIRAVRKGPSPASFLETLRALEAGTLNLVVGRSGPRQ